MRGLPQTLETLAPLLVTLIVTTGATVALCLGKLDATAYVALLAGGAVGAPATAKLNERLKGPSK